LLLLRQLPRWQQPLARVLQLLLLVVGVRQLGGVQQQMWTSLHLHLSRQAWR
jgi:hypothetical protein